MTGKDEPSRPAQEADRDEHQPGEDRDARHRGAAAERGQQADAGGRAERGGERDQGERGARDRAGRVVAPGAAEGAVEHEPERGHGRRRPSRPGPKKNAGGASIVSAAMHRRADQHHARDPRATLDPRRLAAVGRQEGRQRDVGDDPDAADQRGGTERDPEDDRVDPEVAAEAAGDAGDVLVGGRAGQPPRRRGRDAGPGSGSFGSICGSTGMRSKAADPGSIRPLGITLGDPDLSLGSVGSVHVDDFGAA